MASKRIKVPKSCRLVAFYHCCSRIVGREFLLGPQEKQMFYFLMRRYEKFCRVQVNTFCLMDNHFHLVVKVPARPDHLPGDEELCRWIEAFKGPNTAAQELRQLTTWRQMGQERAAEELRARYFARMWDISAFMKELKQAFSEWYNPTHGRVGTLWEGRFESLVVEESKGGLGSISPYTDLNPIRAGLLSDPKDYPWSGYGRACAGDKEALEGLREIVAVAHRRNPQEIKEEEILPLYRQLVYVKGEEEGLDEEGRPLRLGFSREQIQKVIDEKGRVSLAEALRIRVRYFRKGGIYGSRQFVNEVQKACADCFGPKRKTGARRMKGIKEKLYVARDLRVKVFG